MPCSSWERFSFIILLNLFTIFSTSLVRQEHVRKCSHLMELLASSQAHSLLGKTHRTANWAFKFLEWSITRELKPTRILSRTPWFFMPLHDKFRTKYRISVTG
uniref:Uncharacterized protein n=1 Tax=Opuntia streptacantha TaxID=393608 RepID=A0A7C9ELJ4_OPUST